MYNIKLNFSGLVAVMGFHKLDIVGKKINSLKTLD